MDTPFSSEITAIISWNYLPDNLTRWNAESDRRYFAPVAPLLNFEEPYLQICKGWTFRSSLAAGGSFNFRKKYIFLGCVPKNTTFYHSQTFGTFAQISAIFRVKIHMNDHIKELFYVVICYHLSVSTFHCSSAYRQSEPQAIWGRRPPKWWRLFQQANAILRWDAPE